MDLAGFVVGIVGIALGVYQYFSSAQSKRTIRNWGTTIIRRHEAASRMYAEFAARVQHADREEWRSMHDEVFSVLSRGAMESKATAQEVTLYINTVARVRIPSADVDVRTGTGRAADSLPEQHESPAAQ